MTVTVTGRPGERVQPGDHMTNYGPTVVAYRGIAGDPDRVAALDADLAALARRFDVGGGAMEWEYLLLTATVRGRRLARDVSGSVGRSG